MIIEGQVFPHRPNDNNEDPGNGGPGPVGVVIMVALYIAFFVWVFTR